VVILASVALFAAQDTLFRPLKVLEHKGPASLQTPDASGPQGVGNSLLDPAEEAFIPKPVESDNVVHGMISRGEPFFLEMQRAGVSPIDIHEIVQATRDVFNFKKVQPGQKYSIYSDRTGAIDSLKFVVDHEKILKVSKIGDTFHARLDLVPYRIERLVTTATIDQSIFVSLQRIGADPQLAVDMAAIFQWDIDFFKDIHKGDTFSILYEKKVYENGRSLLGNVLAARIVSQGQEHHAFRFTSKDGNTNYYDALGRSLQKSLLRAPLEYSHVSSNFSYHRKHPVTHHWAPHLGVDYAAPTGTPVRATGDGTVAEAGRSGASGNLVRIRHNSQYETYYLHLSRFGKGVHRGARVSQGQVIGYVGMTGLASGPHLDYRIKVNGSFVNPRTIELPSKEPVPAVEMAAFDKVRLSHLSGLLGVTTDNATVAVGKPIYVRPRPERTF
jgi:murein DD-endopeptidase MepM/ murein hydrolase activator NlpD